MTYCHSGTTTNHRPRKQLARERKPRFIQGSEFDSDGEDSISTSHGVAFGKVPHAGFGGMVGILPVTLGASL